MELGQCPRCGEGYTASQVAGLGILRARTARVGGPRLEYECASCGRQIVLIPHGDGRYAPPGQPPPHFVPEAERHPPWAGEGAQDGPDGDPEPMAEPEAAPAPGPADPLDPDEAPPLDESPVGLAEALTLLGCRTTADRLEVERAFRERSLTCHPDKVAHLDPEFQELAERKFKRLRAAYDLLLS